MMMVCRRYVNQIEDAEEILSNGFIKVFSHLDDYQFKGSFEGWIRTIMVREALMHIRSKKYIVEYTDQLERYDHEAGPDPSMDLNQEYLLKMIDSLPDGYKTIFNLYAIEGFKHHEIASMLNISESTSKTQLLRARAFLQNKINSLEKKNHLATINTH
jgi:RNA polymerase sigma factor (sigma-70 family)